MLLCHQPSVGNYFRIMDSLMILLFSFALFMDTDESATAGPFDVFLTDLKVCPEPSRGVEYTHKMMKVTRQKLVMVINLTITVPVDDELGILVNMAKQTNQGWKENFIILDVPKACTVIKQYVPELNNEIGTQMKLPGKTCPYPMGNYTLTLALRINVGVFPVFPYGKYLAKVNLMKKRKRVFCIHGLIDIVPKKSG